MNDHSSIAQLLMRACPQLLVQQDSHGCTPVHYLCSQQNLELVKAVLENREIRSQALRAFAIRNKLMLKPYDLITDQAQRTQIRGLVFKLAREASRSPPNSKSQLFETAQFGDRSISGKRSKDPRVTLNVPAAVLCYRARKESL